MCLGKHKDTRYGVGVHEADWFYVVTVDEQLVVHSVRGLCIGKIYINTLLTTSALPMWGTFTYPHLCVRRVHPLFESSCYVSYPHLDAKKKT